MWKVSTSLVRCPSAFTVLFQHTMLAVVKRQLERAGYQQEHEVKSRKKSRPHGILCASDCLFVHFQAFSQSMRRSSCLHLAHRTQAAMSHLRIRDRRIKVQATAAHRHRIAPAARPLSRLSVCFRFASAINRL